MHDLITGISWDAQPAYVGAGRYQIAHLIPTIPNVDVIAIIDLPEAAAPLPI